jgi:V/A-type H+-transporting ATPase subunit A
MTQSNPGTIVRIAGPVVAAENLPQVSMYEVVYVGHLRLVGEIIRLSGHLATIQVYEDTGGLSVGEPVFPGGNPLMIELGPGLLGSIFDGVQRPLPLLRQHQGDFIARGGAAPPLDREKVWPFEPSVRAGETVTGGDVLGLVPEKPHLAHKILVPPGVGGVIERIDGGAYTIEQTIAVVSQGAQRWELAMRQLWPARRPRPHAGKLDPTEPLLTGQRVIDTLFPLAKGGAAIIPGGFGTGKTVLEHTLAKWSDADVIVYVGCGERGNEMTDVLEEFPRLVNPHTGGPLMDSTVLIANTSNMPVAAREASIYTGVTIAEYFRDMGYNVALMADSTSRWGEALREVSGRLEEMPGEEGYPAYLLSRLAEFYERGGRVTCAGQEPRPGSVTLIGAVSPPGGDFSEPMTQNSLRVTGAFWGLDTKLAHQRHYPAINWTNSYSLYPLSDWFAARVAEDWPQQCRRTRSLLQHEAELQEIVQLVGADTLAENERAELAIGRMLREDFLQQSSFSDDAFCPPEKTYWMLKVILSFYDHTMAALKRALPLEQVLALPVVDQIARMREWSPPTAPEEAGRLLAAIDAAFQER